MIFTTPPGPGTPSGPIQTKHPGARGNSKGEQLPGASALKTAKNGQKFCEGSERGGFFQAREAWVNNRSLGRAFRKPLTSACASFPDLIPNSPGQRGAAGARRGIRLSMEANPCRKQPRILGGSWKTPGRGLGQCRPSRGAALAPRDAVSPLPAFPQCNERGFGVSARTPGLFQRLLLFSRKFQLERSCSAQFGLQESQRSHPWLQSLLSSIEPSVSQPGWERGEPETSPCSTDTPPCHAGSIPRGQHGRAAKKISVNLLAKTRDSPVRNPRAGQSPPCTPRGVGEELKNSESVGSVTLQRSRPKAEVLCPSIPSGEGARALGWSGSLSKPGTGPVNSLHI